ncbi:MAG: esterase-like activity of phytase family protein [Pararhodobacter sp.]
MSDPSSATLSEPPRLRRRRFLALLGLSAAMPMRGSAQIGGQGADTLFVWRERDARFGGFSALHLHDDRQHFLALSDRAWLYAGRLIRDADEGITGVEVSAIHPVRGPDGAALRGPAGDSEGLALGSDGTLYIAFEGGARTRVAAYAQPGGVARHLPRHPYFTRMPGNGALEALAIDSADRLHTLPETPIDGAFPVFRFDTRGWQSDPGRNWQIIGHVPRRGSFAPVGADFGPDGNFYLLERQFRLPAFASRISRIRPGHWDRPETLVETRPGAFDNHEGISITRDARGRLCATTISDDNRFFLQRTEIAEFRLD